MPETPGWTQEDSHELHSDNSNDSYFAREKLMEVNRAAIDDGTATELPGDHLLNGPTREESYLHQSEEAKELEQKIDDITQEALANGEDPEKRTEWERNDLDYINKRLARARQWATTLQQARERGVEIPNGYRSAESFIYHEQELLRQKYEIGEIEAAILDFRGADENEDSRAIINAVRTFPNERESGSADLVNWKYIRWEIKKYAHTPEAEERAQELLSRLDARDRLYSPKIEEYRILAEIQELLLPFRKEELRRMDESFERTKQQIGFIEPEQA